MPEVSEDKMTYTFKLRKGVRFSDDDCFEDGKRASLEVTAQDFLFVFKRFAHPETKAMGWWLFDEKIEGLNEWRDKLRNDIGEARKRGEKVGPLWELERDVPGFEVVDDYTFRFHLAKPYPQFLWVLAMGYTSVYPREAVEYYGKEFQTHPVGTGPFRIKEYNPVYRAVYSRNENYRDVRVPDPVNKPEERWDGWEEDEAAGFLINAGKSVPLIDGIEMRFILEDQPRWLYFKAGYLDFLNPPKDNVAEAIPGGELSEEMTVRGVRVQPWTELGTVYTSLNTEDPLLSNPDVRRAMALAFDHRWTVDNLYGKQAVVATSLIPPGVAGYDVDYHPFHSDDGRAQVDKAKEYLAKAGYPGGVDPKTGRALRLVYENSGSGSTQRQFADRFTDEMRRLGIEVDVVVNTFPQMVDKMRKKKFQVAGLAWGFDYPDSQNILQLLYGPNGSPGINSANFKNEEFDALYRESSVLEDGPERTSIYRRMAKIVSDEVPWITRTHRIRLHLQQPWLQGYKFTEVNYHYWKFVGIDGEKRKSLLSDWNKPNRWPLFVFFAVVGGMIVSTVWRGKK
jgi:ABC-type transport system substrate-binding protein